MILEIDLKKITHNSTYIIDKSQKQGLTVMGITKGVLGNPKIAHAMQEGGIKKFGDSRIKNINKLLNAGFKDITLIKQPLENEIISVIGKVRNIYVSSIDKIELISKHARKLNIIQDITLLIETGDCRDGFLPYVIEKLIGKIKAMKGIKIRGVATNIACARKAKNSLDQMKTLISLSKEIDLGKIEISAANSSSINLLNASKIPDAVTEVRVGEAVILGLETTNCTPIKGLFQDAFILKTKILETGLKCGRLQILLPLGKADIGAGTIKPYDFKGEYIRSTSDHTIITVNKKELFQYRKELKFIPNYYALLGLMISPYVAKKYINN